jgi:hypothetical protein
VVVQYAAAIAASRLYRQSLTVTGLPLAPGRLARARPPPGPARPVTVREPGPGDRRPRPAQVTMTVSGRRTLPCHHWQVSNRDRASHGRRRTSASDRDSDSESAAARPAVAA